MCQECSSNGQCVDSRSVCNGQRDKGRCSVMEQVVVLKEESAV